MKRYIVNRESDSEGSFQLAEAYSSEREGSQTSKPRSPTSLPLEALIEAKAGEVYRN